MLRSRQVRSCLPAALALAAALPLCSRAQTDAAKPAPSGDAPDGPRSRLTLSGLYETDTYTEKNFFLGARGGGTSGEFDAFWTQRLNLRPRFILSDNCNVNLSVDIAHGVWGTDVAAVDSASTAIAPAKRGFLDLRWNRAYLALRHPGSRTRWYLGRQDFSLGNLFVLDADATGLQLYRDFGTTASIGLGFAKESETGSLGDFKRTEGSEVTDGRDADLLYAEWRKGNPERGFHLNPFFVWYLDRGNASGDTWLPDGQELGARFRPHVSSAKIMALAFRLQGARLGFAGEFDYLKGTDRIKNSDSGPGEEHDVNIGDLKGMNGYARLSFAGSRLGLVLTGARGSGDFDPFGGEGNFNSLRTSGRWAATEVWGNGWTLQERGLAPTGLANAYVRGYRGLENTTLMQAALTFRLRSNLSLGGSYTILRSTEVLKGWFDTNGDEATDDHGAIQADEYGRDATGATWAESKELGSEIDWRLDWSIQEKVELSLRGGIFSPGIAAGYLINGTDKHLEGPFLVHLGVRVPIAEFSLGG